MCNILARVPCNINREVSFISYIDFSTKTGNLFPTITLIRNIYFDVWNAITSLIKKFNSVFLSDVIVVVDDDVKRHPSTLPNEALLKLKI